jgi:N-methylhydantoinase A/oxoprolinase/acetone carboxylase beta subunit
MAGVRIGIDVGGTFTDVVVIDNSSHELIGQLKLPTTHGAREGVALGIVTALKRALEQFELDPEDVSFIAHSTTQATNALLEGDVAQVGIIGIGQGIEGWLARFATRVPPIPLTASKRLAPLHTFVSSANKTHAALIERAIDELSAQGAEVIVASEAFGVDDGEVENLFAERARAAGMLATTGHEVSGLYGLRVRTRTAVINAAILPKMIETAKMTESCVKSSGIRAPLMIMRSDGGVMRVAELHRRPILTMLSGPAAGIAGALMHERASDGIFIEVGGTSTDISVIRDGSPVARPARLNGHRMYLNTLDVRTIGVAGGSMVRAFERGAPHRAAITDVGPRSAHIAGLDYVCFTAPEELAGATLELIRPAPGDPADHVVVRAPKGKRYAITTTCAANLLGYIKPEHFAYGRRESAALAFKLLAERFSTSLSAEAVARQVLEVACHKVIETIEEMIAEYHLARDQVVLIGGGGGAAALVPYTAELMRLQHRLARNAEVISPIGVAMAMVRDTIERNLVDPTPEDILRLWREATEAAIAAGARPESVRVQVEVERQRNLVRATAMGTTELRRREDKPVGQSVEQCRQSAARSMQMRPEAVKLVAETSGHLVFAAEQQRRSLFGLLSSRRPMLRVVDRAGVVRLQRGAARVSVTDLKHLNQELEQAVEQLTDYGDAGRKLPEIFILYEARLVNFSGLASLDQVKALAEVELRLLDPSTRLVVIACPKQA